MSAADDDTILFDAGGTLVFLDCVRVARLLCCAHPDGAVRLAQSWYHTVFAYDEQLLAEGLNWQSLPEDRRWAWFWNRMTEFAGLDPVSDETAGCLGAENRRLSLWDQTSDEVRSVLEYLSGRYRLGVVSNADGSVAGTFARLGLDRWFSVIVDSEVVGVSKPDPRIFDHALQPLGAQAARTVFIGDSYALDAVGAARAGIRPLLLDPHGLHTHRGVQRIAGLADLRARF